MMKKLVKYFTLLLVFASFMAVSSESFAQEWEHYSSAGGITIDAKVLETGKFQLKFTNHNYSKKIVEYTVYLTDYYGNTVYSYREEMIRLYSEETYITSIYNVYRVVNVNVEHFGVILSVYDD